jgi:hypothetical protein
MLRFILIALAVYVLYKLVFDLIIPIFRATRQVRKQFRNMQQHMQQQASRHQPDQATNNFQQNTPPKKTATGEYIDFEEIK